MIGLESNLTGDLAGALDQFEKEIQGKVILSGVAAMARVVYDEVKLNTSGARKTDAAGGPPGKVTGNLDAAIYRVYLKERSTDAVKIYRVSVNKTKAPHWYLVEYGSSQSPAHPYIRPAADKLSDAVKAGQARMTERMGEIAIEAKP